MATERLLLGSPAFRGQMTGARRRWGRIVLLILVQIAFAVGAVEVLGQLYFHNPYSYWEHRFVFMTQDGVRNIGKAWTYAPGREIKETIIYQTPLGGFEKESECEYPIDRLGLVDNENTDRREFDLLLLGNSFTQGQGGCPWASTLRRYLPNVSIYNAGLYATGPGNWAETTRYLMEEGLRFRTVIVIFISDDFTRYNWNHSNEQLDCLHDITKCDEHSFFYPITPNLDLVRISRERAEAQDLQSSRERALPLGMARVLRRAHYFWNKYLWVSYFLASNTKNLVLASPSRPLITQDAKEGLAWLMANHPNVKFVEIRQKDEAALDSSNAMTLLVEQYLRGRKVDWAVCDVGYDGFLQNDGHPNRQGYDRLAQCLSKVVQGFQGPWEKSPVGIKNDIEPRLGH